MRNRIAGLALATLLPGCTEVSSGLMAASALSRLALGWRSEPAVATAAPAPADTPLYCYRTLADADCHAAPLAAHEDMRRIGQAAP